MSRIPSFAFAFAALALALLAGCSSEPGTSAPATAVAAPVPPVAEDGVRRIPVTLPSGTFEVWTRKVGSNPTVKILLLHGGPGMSHDYLEALEAPLVEAGFEIYFYDQLGSHLSDRPEVDDAFLEVPRFVDEVEQVRAALGLGPDEFYLYGQSWGGILAIEYALAHPDRLKGLVISNMMASIPAYNVYARDVLMPAMDPAALAEIQALEAAGDVANPRYMELLVAEHYVEHILRRPAEEWPDALDRTFEYANHDIYVAMQGPSELGASGTLEHWDRTADLARIEVPTLVIGATHDTMDPAHMEWMAGQFPRGRFLLCPEGSHLAMWDDPEHYFPGLIEFLKDVDAGTFE